MTDRRKLLYILAPSFSGSTLLTYLLAQHRQISTIGELKATQMGDIDEYRCSCGTMIRECDFWREVEMRAKTRGIDFSVDNFGTVYHSDNRFINKVVKASVRGPWFEWLRVLVLFGTPARLSGMQEITRQNLNLSQIVCDMQGGKIFLDGSKDSARLLHFINSGCWDIRVIYLQRDGRGVSNSYRRHDGLQYDEAVSYWRRAIQELQHMRRRLDDAVVFDLLYEDLCQQPEHVLSTIWRWLKMEDQPIRDLDLKDGKSHILGNSMRLSNVSEIRLDEAWKSKLSTLNLGIFESGAGELNRQLGYR